MDRTAQQDIVRNLQKSNTSQAGQLWFLVAQRWFAEWEAFVAGTQEAPEAIANDVLLENGSLKPGLIEFQDYMLVNGAVWEKLQSWYGGGPAVARPMIEAGLKRRLVVEVYPMKVRVSERRNLAHDEVVEISKGATGLRLLQAACTRFSMAPHRCMIWKLGVEGYVELKLQSVLQQSGIDEGAELILEEKLPDGAFEPNPPVWIRPKNLASANNALMNGFFSRGGNFTGGGMMSMPRAIDSDAPAPERGVTGLVNLGNTCFMNSSLQCVAACPSLVEFLQSSKLEDQINRNNPLGMGGRVAKSLAELVSKMWAEHNVKFVVPRAVKDVISDFAPQFEGYRQHDAQEFLAFLLDGLHEDVNLVKVKKMVETENAFGLDDKVAASQAWDRHLMRNRSEIVNLFHGQMRSRLVCPSCKNVSVTFDPFSFLSLPLPRSTTRRIAVTFVPKSLSSETVEQWQVEVSRAATIGELKEALGALVGVKKELLLIAEVYQRSLYREYVDAMEVASLGPNDDIFAFEVDQMNDAKPKKKKEGEMKLGSVVTFCLILRKEPDLAAFGTPLVFSLPVDGLSVEKIEGACNKLVAMHCKKRGSAPLSSPLFIVTKSGKGCPSCGDSLCKGCQLTPDMLKKGSLKHRMNVALNFEADAEFSTTRKSKGSDKDEADDKKKTLLLGDCIDRFLAPEILAETDTWYCPGCKNHVQAEKQIGLWSMPRVLVIHLKRFAYLSNRYREKLEDVVAFPLQGLDMRPYLLPGSPSETKGVYDLFAVSNHMGGLGGGHYTAYAKNSVSGKWWLCNDESCSEVDNPENSVISRAAYLLFYQLRDK